MLKKILKNIGKKIISCPSCKGRLRLPVRPNKTLLVSCPHCQGQFNLQFKSFFGGLPTWQKGRGIKYNLKSLAYFWNTLPITKKIFLIIFISLTFSIFSTFVSGVKESKRKELSPTVEKPFKII